MLVAIGYKVGLAPFHLWVADVYEGAPTPVAAFIAVFPKVAGYAVLMRMLFIPFAQLREVWVPVLMVMSMLSMVWGNLMAMRQTSFKRLMAFSGIAHMGYIMIGIVAASYSTHEASGSLGFRAAMYYMLVYFFMNIGAFVVAMIVETYGGTDHLDSYNGLYRRNPPLAILMTILLAALIGLPPTCGFWAKFHVFTSLTWHYTALANQVLLALAVLTTVIGAYYYLKLAHRMFILPAAPEASRRLKPPLFMRLAVSVPTILILALGLFYVDVPYNYVKESWFLETLTPGTSI
jgi:proton-translocating NADH-quinone oxidoreductase chain N